MYNLFLIPRHNLPRTFAGQVNKSHSRLATLPAKAFRLSGRQGIIEHHLLHLEQAGQGTETTAEATADVQIIQPQPLARTFQPLPSPIVGHCHAATSYIIYRAFIGQSAPVAPLLHTDRPIVEMDGRRFGKKAISHPGSRQTDASQQ